MAGSMGGTFDDLALHENLDQKTLEDQLHSRYESKQIYTWIGDILIAINPFEDLGLYTPAVASKYSNVVRAKVPPHVFATADAAYTSATHTKQSQVVIVSGESGAGKTETTKLVVEHVLRLCSSHDSSLRTRIIQMSPALEACGNAQTVMNNNSSRFGKYLELKIDGSGNVIGAGLSEYLLERSRVVQHSTGEQCFHVFYYLCHSQCRGYEGMHLQPPEHFAYLNQGGQFCMDAATTKEWWDEFDGALTTVGILPNQKVDIITILASILNLGNVVFDENEMTEEAQVRDMGLAFQTAELLSVDCGMLVQALSKRVTVMRGETITKTLTAVQATANRDSAAKRMFGLLFSWVVGRLNVLLAPDAAAVEATSIGLLDIFGFENFAVNSFEQLCINLANEQLQLFFNDHIFQLEVEEMKKEGLGEMRMEYKDNRPVLDLFTRKPIGLFTLLDEESRLQSSTATSFGRKMGDHLQDQCLKVGSTSFAITHYAGKVDYQLKEMIPKNRDELPEAITELLVSSGCSLVKHLFSNVDGPGGSSAPPPPKAGGFGRRFTKKASRRKSVKPSMRRGGGGGGGGGGGRGKKKKKATVCSAFAASLQLLIAKMSPCDPHFVRCVKPNRSNAKSLWEEDYVVNQLKYTGMLETVRIRREGYALRVAFADFMMRYSIIGFPYSSSPKADRGNVQKVLQAAGLTGWQVGKTKVFLKYHHGDALSKLMYELATNAMKIQSYLRVRVARRKLQAKLAVARLEKEAADAFFHDMMAESNRICHIQSVTDDEDTARAHAGQLSATSTMVNVNKRTSIGPRPTVGSKEQRKRSKRMQKEKSKWIQSETKMGALRATAKSQRDPRLAQDALVAPWFKGPITRQTAEEMLYGTPTGTYLVRMSESRLAYTLSTVQAGQFRHYPIEALINSKEQVPGYRLMGSAEKFNELTELLDHYKKTCMSTKHRKEKLKRPVGATIPDGENPDKEIQYAELSFTSWAAAADDPADDFTEAVAEAMKPTKNPNVKVSLDTETIITMQGRFGKRQPSMMQHARRKKKLPPPITGASLAPIAVGHDYNQLSVIDQLLAEPEPDDWGVADDESETGKRTSQAYLQVASAASSKRNSAGGDSDYADFDRSKFENSRRMTNPTDPSSEERKADPGADYRLAVATTIGIEPPKGKKKKSFAAAEGGLGVTRSERKKRNTEFREAEKKILLAAKENAKRVKQLKKNEKKKKKKKKKVQAVPMHIYGNGRNGMGMGQSMRSNKGEDYADYQELKQLRQNMFR